MPTVISDQWSRLTSLQTHHNDTCSDVCVCVSSTFTCSVNRYYIVTIMSRQTKHYKILHGDGDDDGDTINIKTQNLIFFCYFF